MLKQWWHERENREQVILSIGSVIVAAIIVYFFIWSPLDTATQNAETATMNNASTLRFVLHAKNEIAALKAAGFSADTASNASLLNVVEQGLNTAKLSKFIKQVQQPSAGQIQIMLQNVPFDPLMDWLQSAWRQHGVQVAAMGITHTDTSGVVNLTMTLKRR